jgi:hypothetical protein
MFKKFTVMTAERWADPKERAEFCRQTGFIDVLEWERKHPHDKTLQVDIEDIREHEQEFPPSHA